MTMITGSHWAMSAEVLTRFSISLVKEQQNQSLMIDGQEVIVFLSVFSTFICTLFCLKLDEGD